MKKRESNSCYASGLDDGRNGSMKCEMSFPFSPPHKRKCFKSRELLTLFFAESATRQYKNGAVFKSCAKKGFLLRKSCIQNYFSTGANWTLRQGKKGAKHNFVGSLPCCVFSGRVL